MSNLKEWGGHWQHDSLLSQLQNYPFSWSDVGNEESMQDFMKIWDQPSRTLMQMGSVQPSLPTLHSSCGGSDGRSLSRSGPWDSGVYTSLLPVCSVEWRVSYLFFNCKFLRKTLLYLIVCCGRNQAFQFQASSSEWGRYKSGWCTWLHTKIQEEVQLLEAPVDSYWCVLVSGTFGRKWTKDGSLRNLNPRRSLVRIFWEMCRSALMWNPSFWTLVSLRSAQLQSGEAKLRTSKTCEIKG